MAWIKRKKAVTKTAGQWFRFIYNNLLNAWEVWDAVTGTLDQLRDDRDEVVSILDENRERLSQDYQDAERYVQEGVSEAKDIWEDIKGAYHGE